MARGQSTDPFYQELDRKTAMGPGVRKILSTPLEYNDSDLQPTEKSTGESQASAEMPRYRSHKEVWALKIATVEEVGIDTTTDENAIVMITFTDAGFAPIRMNLRGKPTPSAGWYYVVYPDGYKSFSPEKAFEEGYTRI